MRYIRAIILDGFHKAHTFHMEYHPTVKLLRPSVIRVDYCCDGMESQPTPVSYDEYKECFRGVDGKTVMYSTKGESDDAFRGFGWRIEEKPWSYKTVLYMGYHDEPIRRVDREDTPPKGTEG